MNYRNIDTKEVLNQANNMIDDANILLSSIRSYQVIINEILSHIDSDINKTISIKGENLLDELDVVYQNIMKTAKILKDQVSIILETDEEASKMLKDVFDMYDEGLGGM